MARPKFPSDDSDRTMLRMPPGMKERLAQEANSSGRSINSEIVARLSLSLETVGDLSAVGLHATARRLEANAEATELAAQHLFYELALLSGMDVSQKRQLGSAIDAYITQAGGKLYRHQAVRTILEDWLTEHGFMPTQDIKKVEDGRS